MSPTITTSINIIMKANQKLEAYKSRSPLGFGWYTGTNTGNNENWKLKVK